VEPEAVKHAFPSGSWPCDGGPGATEPLCDGMTLRQYYAAKAMQGLLTTGVITGVETQAFRIADAMLQFEESE
jgi:hypothetical protein